jgi:cytochrome b
MSVAEGKPSPLAWDLPARVCHWGFAASMIGALWIGFREDPRGDLFTYHMPLGALALWFLAVRIVLGFAGGPLSRWRAFVHRPATTLRYFAGVVRWRSVEPAGLNPGTALFAPAIYLGAVAIVVTGFVADWVETWHGRIAWAAVALTASHLAGLALHAGRHRAPTFLAMIHGRRPEQPAGRLTATARNAAGLVLLAASVLLAWLVWRGFDPELSVLRLPGLPEIDFRLIQRG